METLAEKMHARFKLDDCGDRCVVGKRGDVHRGSRDGESGYFFSLLYPSIRTFNNALKKVDQIGVITAHGDTEAILFVPRQTALENARLLRAVIKAKRIRQVSPETARAGAERLRKYRESLSKEGGSGEETRENQNQVAEDTD